MNLKINIYVAILLNCQPQKTHKKKKGEILHLMIHDARAISW